MLKQLTIFDTVSEIDFQVHDKVRLILLEEAADSELHNFRKYYYPHLINRIGEIQSIAQQLTDSANYNVLIAGEQIQCTEKELQWIA